MPFKLPESQQAALDAIATLDQDFKTRFLANFDRERLRKRFRENNLSIYESFLSKSWEREKDNEGTLFLIALAKKHQIKNFERDYKSMFKWNQDLRSVKIAHRHGMRTASVNGNVRGFTHRPLNTITSFLNETPGVPFTQSKHSKPPKGGTRKRRTRRHRK